MVSKNTNTFSIVLNYRLFKKGLVLHLNKLRSLHPTIVRDNFSLNLHIGFGEDENVKSLRQRQQKTDTF